MQLPLVLILVYGGSPSTLPWPDVFFPGLMIILALVWCCFLSAAVYEQVNSQIASAGFGLVSVTDTVLWSVVHSIVIGFGVWARADATRDSKNVIESVHLVMGPPTDDRGEISGLDGQGNGGRS
jgi:hypothetical protein